MDIRSYERQLTRRLRLMERNQRNAFVGVCLERLVLESYPYIVAKAGEESAQVLKTLIETLWGVVLSDRPVDDVAITRLSQKIESISWDDLNSIPQGQEALDECGIQTLNCAIIALDVLRNSGTSTAGDAGICLINKVHSDIMWDRSRNVGEEVFADPRMVRELERQSEICLVLEQGQPVTDRFRRRYVVVLP